MMVYNWKYRYCLFLDHPSHKTVHHPEAATRCVLCKKVFLEISQNSQEITRARVSILIKFIKNETLAKVFL